MKIKFKSKKAFNTCYTFVNGNGFCFRNHNSRNTLQFYYEYTLRNIMSICDNELGLKDEYELIE